MTKSDRACARFLLVALVSGAALYSSIFGLALWVGYSMAFATETVTAITTSMFSYHFDREKERCEVNPGIGVEHGSVDLRFAAGGYHGSECRPVWYVGGGKTWEVSGPWRAGVAGILAAGYHKEKKGPNGERVIEDRVLPVPMLIGAYEGKFFGFDFGGIPVKDGVVFFRLKFIARR